jgi:hypothetical protein
VISETLDKVKEEGRFIMNINWLVAGITGPVVILVLGIVSRLEGTITKEVSNKIVGEMWLDLSFLGDWGVWGILLLGLINGLIWDFLQPSGSHLIIAGIGGTTLALIALRCRYESLNPERNTYSWPWPDPKYDDHFLKTAGWAGTFHFGFMIFQFAVLILFGLSSVTLARTVYLVTVLLTIFWIISIYQPRVLLVLNLNDQELDMGAREFGATTIAAGATWFLAAIKVATMVNV